MKMLTVAILLQASLVLAEPSPAPSPSPSGSPYPSPSAFLVGCTAKTKCGDGSEISCTGSGLGQCKSGRNDKNKNYVSCSDDNGVTWVTSTCTN